MEKKTVFITSTSLSMNDWVITDSAGNVLAHKPADADPIFINAEAAVLRLVEIVKLGNESTAYLEAEIERIKNLKF